jgi:hypothetical protein
MTSAARHTTAFAAIAGSVLMLATTVAYLLNDQGFSQGEVPGTIQVWAFIAYGVAIVGLVRLFEPAAPRAAMVTIVVGLVGVAGGAAYGIDAIGLQALGGSIVDSSDVAPFALRIPGLAFPVAVFMVGFFLARHSSVPTVAGYGLVVAAVLFPVAHIGDIIPLGLASDVIAVLAMGAIALSLLSADETHTQVHSLASQS